MRKGKNDIAIKKFQNKSSSSLIGDISTPSMKLHQFQTFLSALGEMLWHVNDLRHQTSKTFLLLHEWNTKCISFPDFWHCVAFQAHC